MDYNGLCTTIAMDYVQLAMDYVLLYTRLDYVLSTMAQTRLLGAILEDIQGAGAGILMDPVDHRKDMSNSLEQYRDLTSLVPDSLFPTLSISSLRL